MAYTCACKVVRDEDVIEVIDGGASTVDEVADRCGAGTECGGCLPTIEAFLALAAAEADDRLARTRPAERTAMRDTPA